VRYWIVKAGNQMRITHRDSRWLSLFLFVITFTAGCASNSNFTQEQSPSQTQDVNSPDKASAKETIETVKQNLIKFPGKVWRNGKATYTKPENLAALLIAGSASIAMHQEADKKSLIILKNINNLKTVTLKLSMSSDIQRYIRQQQASGIY
jgi:hypothetical protein